MAFSKLLLRSNARLCAANLRPAFFNNGMSTAAAAEEIHEPLGWSEAKPFSDIPGPKSWPIVKSMPYLLTKLPCRMDEWTDLMAHLRKTFGDVVRFEIPGRATVVSVFDPLEVEHILRNGVTSWPERTIFQYMVVYRKQTRKHIFEDNAGVMLEDGKVWWDLRSKTQQPMMRPKSSHMYLPAIDQVAGEFIEKIKAMRNPQTREVDEDFQDELAKFTLESIALVALNTRLGCFSKSLSPDSDGQRMIDAARKWFELSSKLEMSFPFWKYYPTKTWKEFVNCMDVMNEVGIKHVNRQVEELKKKDNHDQDLSVLEMFLVTPGLTKKEAVTMALDMLIAGVDTAATSIAFLLYHLAKNPEVQRKIQQEVDAALPGKDKPVTVDALNKLPYMKASLKESMRLNPIVFGIFRRLQNDVIVKGYRLPKGTLVMPGAQEMSLDEQHYPDPLQFKPERWLRGDPLHNSASPYTYLPFGHGPRMCIGKRIAEHEIWVLIAKLMQHFSLEYHHEDIGVLSRFVNVPDRPLLLQFHDRSS